MNQANELLVIEGYASRFGERDLAGDVVRPGAFEHSLIHRPAMQIKMLFQHDASEPIGVWDQVYENQTGLFVRGTILASGPRGRTARSLVQRATIDGLSIGFRTRKAAPLGKGRQLKQIELWEVSIVTFPMLPRARLRVVHNPNPALTGIIGRQSAR